MLDAGFSLDLVLSYTVLVKFHDRYSRFFALQTVGFNFRYFLSKLSWDNVCLGGNREKDCLNSTTMTSVRGDFFYAMQSLSAALVPGTSDKLLTLEGKNTPYQF